MGQNNHNKVENKTKNEQERGATRPATRVGLRPVEAGLGGNDDGSWGVDEGVENTSTQLWKRRRSAWSDCAAFSVFVEADSEFVSKNRNDLKGQGYKTSYTNVTIRISILIAIHNQSDCSIITKTHRCESNRPLEVLTSEQDNIERVDEDKSNQHSFDSQRQNHCLLLQKH